MSLFIGSMKKRINGHKELTDHKETISYFKSELIYIPLTHGGKAAELLVKEGDHVKVGTLVAQRLDHFFVPFFASCSGVVKGIEKRMHSSLTIADHLVIENDFKYEEEKYEGINYKDTTKEEIIDFVKRKGFVGQGGAAFPTYIKYEDSTKIDTLVINGVECEPYITVDYVGSKEYADALKDGVLALLKVSEAKKCIIAIKKTKTSLIAKLNETFADESKVKIVGVQDAYPMGWERVLIYELTKKRYKNIPIEIGVVVSNITTAINLGKTMLTGIPTTAKVVTVSGDGIKNPSNVHCPIGTPSSELIELCGGFTAEEIQLIAGGPMMGKAMTTDKVVIAQADSALTILKYKEVKEMGCLRCGACLENCPVGLQPLHINEAERTKNTTRLEKLNYNNCIECGLCTYVCPSKIAVTEGIRRAKRMMALRKK